MRWFVLTLAAVTGTGCSFLVHFDPETQPCDSAGQCLPSYFCSDAGYCKALDGGSTTLEDGGGSGTDGGTCAARETACGDGRDEDCDGKTDCADTDCGGFGCNDGDPCTSGEVCSGGACMRGTAITCNTPPSTCQSPTGACTADAGRCVYAPLADGTVCGAGQAARCCTGNCINTTINNNNCGGCGLACATGQTCQPIEQSSCSVGEPNNTSGRCGCSAGSPCPNGQTCQLNGRCAPTLAAQCAPGQTLGDAGVCINYCRY